MPPAMFEHEIPAIERPQTHAFDCTATGIGSLLNKCTRICQNKFRASVPEITGLVYNIFDQVIFLYTRPYIYISVNRICFISVFRIIISKNFFYCAYNYFYALNSRYLKICGSEILCNSWSVCIFYRLETKNFSFYLSQRLSYKCNPVFNPYPANVENMANS